MSQEKRAALLNVLDYWKLAKGVAGALKIVKGEVDSSLKKRTCFRKGEGGAGSGSPCEE